MFDYRKARWFIAAPLMVVTTGALVAASRPEPASGCQALSSWVQAHRKALPQTYAEIIRYPLDYRKKILGALPAQIRRSMWEEQFRVYARSGLLNSEQQAFLARYTVVSAQLFSGESSVARKAQLADSLLPEALNILGRDLTHSVLYVLGPDDRVEPDGASRFSGPGPRVPDEFEAALAHPASVPEFADNCDCHIINGGTEASPPECETPNRCAHSNPECANVTETGCGQSGSGQVQKSV